MGQTSKDDTKPGTPYKTQEEVGWSHGDTHPPLSLALIAVPLELAVLRTLTFETSEVVFW